MLIDNVAHIINNLPIHHLVEYSNSIQCFSYKVGKPYNYVFKQLFTLRAMGCNLPIILYTFENSESVLKNIRLKDGIYIVRLPVDTQYLHRQINAWETNIAGINRAIEIAQEAYLDETLQLLKHGKELELLNTTLNPLRAMSMNVLTGISSMEKWDTLRSAILYKLQKSPEYSELFLIAERINNSHQKHYPFRLFINKLFLSLNKQTHISEMNSYITDIDNLICDFDELFK